MQTQAGEDELALLEFWHEKLLKVADDMGRMMADLKEHPALGSPNGSVDCQVASNLGSNLDCAAPGPLLA